MKRGLSHAIYKGTDNSGSGDQRMQGISFSNTPPSPAESRGEPDEYAPSYDPIETDESYTEYTGTRPRTVDTYQEMMDADWVDEPLKELLETRINDMLER